MTASPTPVRAVQSFEDPISFEVFRSGLTGLANEMGLVTLRTSHSPILNQALDFSTALCDAEGRVLAQGNSMMIHLGTFPDAMSALLRKAGDTLRQGDVFIFNEEDDVAQHLPDLYVIRPYFDGETLLGFGVCTAHHVDIGGRSPGGMDIESTEIFQEGLQLPLVRLYSEGALNQDIMDILMRNVREPELYAGDLDGQLAALALGEQGMRDLVQHYSHEGFRRLSDELLDYAERLARAEIDAIPDGRYTFEDALDNDGFGSTPVRLAVAVTVTGDTLEVDWTGTDPQVPSALNCHITNTRAISYGALQAVFRGDVVSNSGFYRPVSVKAEPGTLVHSTRPAARGVRGITIYRMIDVMLGALAQAVPDRVPAAADGGPALILMSGKDRTGRAFVESLGPFISGWGAGLGADGNQGASPLGANFATMSVERMESAGIVRIDRWGLVTDSGGAGRWRGCLGAEVDLTFLTETIRLQVRTERHDIAPYGFDGGQPGGRCRNILNPGVDQVELSAYCTVNPSAGETVRHMHAGAGGFGDPLLRDPSAVLEDVLDGKVSVQAALEQYGVVIDEAAGLVDADRTEQRRSTMGEAPRTTSDPAGLS